MTVQENQKMSSFYFLHSQGSLGVGVSFQAYNMIPFHGIRSGFGMRHAVLFFFRFLAALHVATPKIM